MSANRVAIAITTDGSGAATVYSTAVTGRLEAFQISIGTLAAGAVDLTITEEDTGASLGTFTNLAASGRFPIRVPTYDTSGAAISGGTTTPNVNGRIKIVVAQGGAAHTGTVYAYVDSGSTLDAFVTRTFTPGAVFLSSTVQQGLPSGRANT